jgi:hypothetical protein
MLLSALLLSGLALVVAVVALVVSMARADRRARRSLFRNLDLNEETVDLLMSRNGDVRAELALVRVSPPAELLANAEPAPEAPRPTIRLIHPIAGEPRTPGERRDELPSDRQHRL